MNEDTIYLLLAYIIYGITFFTLMFNCKNKRLMATNNLSLLATYSLILLYNLKYNSGEGKALVWYMGILFCVLLHSLIQLILLLMYRLKQKK
jgi:hypothetical protein